MFRLKLLEDPYGRDTAGRRRAKGKISVDFQAKRDEREVCRTHPFNCRPPWLDLEKRKKES